jgi:flagellar biosynthetic protein FliR
MPSDPITGWVLACLLVSLRVAPVFALAPPFTLTRVPVTFRALFGVAMAACLVAGNPAATRVVDTDLGFLALAAMRELLLGGVFVMAFQLTFGALYVAGRTLDIQAGYGLAMLIDPTSRAQTPLIGTIFALIAGAVFFSLNGPGELLRLMSASLEAMPLGTGRMPGSLAGLTTFLSVIFVAAFGVAGGMMLCLFLTDLAIALLSRTVPQMNVLILGFQVKTILLLLVLPATFGVAGALIARMLTLTLQAIPGML